MITTIAVAVANQKGGVAKTTTAAAMSAALKRRGYRVLAVDMDPQGNLSDCSGAEAYQLPTIYELLKKVATASEVIQHLDAYDAIPANIMLAGAEQELLAETGKEHRLAEVLAPVKDLYDFIVIDTPPSLGVLTVNALTCANEVIIPATAGIFAVNGIKQLGDTIENVRKYCNSGLEIRGILLTKFNPRTTIGKNIKDLTEGIGKYIDAAVFDTFIRNSVVVEEAQAVKADLYIYKAASTVAEDYNAFVDEYLQKKGLK
jgi:chromosome partitioning protein